MDLFDFFLPEVAEATHLRKIAKTLEQKNRHGSREAKSSKTASAKLREDVNFLSLLVMALIKQSIQNDNFSLDELLEICSEIDTMDGVKDGGLDVNILRGTLGILKEEKPRKKTRSPRKRTTRRR